MNVLVDTSVWYLALRRRRVSDNAITRELGELIRDGRVVLLGAIRQELLSGVKEPTQFTKLRDTLRAFEDLSLTHEDYELAAANSNACRATGIQGSPIDFLLCGVAMRRSLTLFTTDQDFAQFANILPLRLHEAYA
jgi:predicted nucleic acid-binding protein